MKTRIFRTTILALLCLALPAMSSAAEPATVVPQPEYRSFHIQIDVDKPVAEVWAKVGAYCDISKWVANFDCRITSGEGELGTVRVLAGGRITEVLIAKSEHGYGYAQPAIPGQYYNLYHGFMEARALTPSTSRIHYSVMMDVANLPDAAAKDAIMTSRKAAFETALKNMKRISEGG
jgi:hypothetical protein